LPRPIPWFLYIIASGALNERSCMRWLFTLIALLLPGILRGADAPGLAVTFKNEQNARDLTTLPNFALHVEAGQPPTPFVPTGNFLAIWDGNLVADLRSDFFFTAELNGTLKFEINGMPVLEGSGPTIPLSKAIQLKKGPNSVRAVFISPPKGPAFLRVGWTDKGTNTSPIPPNLLTHSPTPQLGEALQLRRGRELFLEHRCARCHAEPRIAKSALPELSMDAPSFEGIGARRKYDWMLKWIGDPKSERPIARMPQLLRGPKAPDEAKAIGAYLASLKTRGDVTLPEHKRAPREGDPPTAPLFERLRCTACHVVAGDETNKISLRHVAGKFPTDKLSEFLRKPEAHYQWTHMPNFKLTAEEAKELTEFLTKDATKSPDTTPDAAMINRGRDLAQTVGCLNCHTLKLDNKFSAPALKDWTRGCLAEAPTEKAPQYGFSAAQRADLQAFGRSGVDSLLRHSPIEFAQRQTRLLNCSGCHGQPEGFPLLEVLGGKLKPEWSAKFIAGDIPYKPRLETHPRGEPWLEIRMPAFQSRAGFLAEGMAALHGFPPKTPDDPPLDNDLAKIGQKLVGKEGGFSCVSCHAVGGLVATDVFESEGINLAWSYERLLRDYYYRWMRHPLSIDPQTKMPVYFEDGKSPLTEILDGDAEKQITAVWHYLRLGEKMPPPNTGEAP
jgi:mono/diheme cytochrome c family protein